MIVREPQVDPDLWREFISKIPPELLQETPTFKQLRAQSEAIKLEMEQAERQRAREQAEHQAALAREQAERQAALAREQAERQAALAREQAERQAREQAERQAAQAKLAERRHALLRTVTRLFGEPPAPLVARIEATDDAELLGLWWDAAFDAATLTEFEAAISDS